MLQNWEGNKLPLDHDDIKSWITSTMRYFKNCWKGDGDDGTEWFASNLTMVHLEFPLAQQDLHAGVHMIRKYYPDFVATEEHFPKPDPRRTTGPISRKPYRCTSCKTESTQSTNHWGKTYAQCRNCGYPEHECLEAMPEGYAKPEPWTITNFGGVIS